LRSHNRVNKKIPSVMNMKTDHHDHKYILLYHIRVSNFHNLNICFNTILPTRPYNQNPWDSLKILFPAHGSGLKLHTTKVLKKCVEGNFSL
jgi:hypothetical protein